MNDKWDLKQYSGHGGTCLLINVHYSEPVSTNMASYLNQCKSKMFDSYLIAGVAALGANGESVGAVLVGDTSGCSAVVPGRIGLGGANML